MRFEDVRALVPYLQSLGVSHLYLSPSLRARSGSTHGYDVVDPTQVSESLGGEDATTTTVPAQPVRKRPPKGQCFGDPPQQPSQQPPGYPAALQDATDAAFRSPD